MRLPDSDLVVDFFTNYIFAFVSVSAAGFCCFCCMLYMFGVLCDRQPKFARGAVMFIWVLTFLQSFMLFRTYKWYVPVLAILHHMMTIPLVFQIPTIVIYSALFYLVIASTCVSHMVTLAVFFFNKYQLHELVFVFITFHTVVVFIISSLKFNEERVVSTELSQSYNIVVNLAAKVLNWMKIKGGSLHKRL
ncbi:hypothetical protein EIN_155860 [Entamoeba invadens IP1]|uniref:Uncharacterized protein n=1 Tax=Entamoeba invadens IP1 TaxID=370355 RepID=A0A0A1U973_ENTIV|nr:hypothetical protein EIN_155860 [Entamoeba invadens IP1]ELP91459.1 hypothetical protein EIN_155860 [Entamoeba invadens IP1]|eukprot:XP_004258230.1 hypothetical protein EIN_155860 [Entamoeba invadens IP1]